MPPLIWPLKFNTAVVVNKKELAPPTQHRTILRETDATTTVCDLYDRPIKKSRGGSVGWNLKQLVYTKPGGEKRSNEVSTEMAQTQREIQWK